MSIKNYLKERLLFLSINIIFFIPLAIFLLYVNLHLVWVFGIFITWFFPIVTFFIIDYTQKHRFYNSIEESLNSLDKKYLLSETIEEPEFLEGRIMYETLKSVEKDMYSHIKYYEDKQIEYREYIEGWIHEIKTPIASTKLIIDNNKTETTKNIEKEILKLEDYVEQVLYYSRSNDTSKDYIVKELNLGIAITNVIRRNSKDFIYKNIKLTLEDIDNEVYTDIKWIEFIINQVLNNAIKYSKKEDAKIKIYSKRNEHNVALSIEDNGIGIPMKDIRRVFEKGFTGENGRKYGKSTGMGLYICKKLSNKLGLGLELTSEENKGTKVNIIFPLGKITLLES